METNQSIITPEAAATIGLIPVTEPCNADEEWILEGVEADMVRGGIMYCIVEERGGRAIWRQPPKLMMVRVRGWVKYNAALNMFN